MSILTNAKNKLQLFKESKFRAIGKAIRTVGSVAGEIVRQPYMHGKAGIAVGLLAGAAGLKRRDNRNYRKLNKTANKNGIYLACRDRYGVGTRKFTKCVARLRTERNPNVFQDVQDRGKALFRDVGDKIIDFRNNRGK